ncbi:hypothetical protein Tco_0696067 [Tanacetum coccineum]
MDGASGLGRLPRWQLLGLVGGGKGLDWVEEGLGFKSLGGSRSLDKPELVDAHLSFCNLCFAKVSCVLRHSIGVSSAGVTNKVTCIVVLTIWPIASAVVTAVTTAVFSASFKLEFFPTYFVVVDFKVGRSFLRTGRALIHVYGEEITLRVDNESVTFNLDQTTRYSSTNDKSVNRINIIDAVCEEYALEFLGFPNSSGGNPIPTSESFTSEFILEEIEAYLKDDSISPEIDHANCNPEEDICLIEKLLNNDPFQHPSMDLKQSKVTKSKSLIEEPPELELKDLPSHLEYTFLEENYKLPVIIAKGLENDEKYALLKVLKSHKGAIAWKITDIKGIDPRFCTHKLLMEDDYKPTVQSQRRVNPKIHEKGGITVVANEENELILTRLVTGWRVCIDYSKLNEATRKDHFPLPFMDQMIERLAGNEFYCFLDGFSGYFQIPIDPL